MKLILGTKNPGKLNELFALAGADSGIQLALAPNEYDPEETGLTFEENAIIKGRRAAQLTSCLSLGEDSGIAVEALADKPGIYSARYCAGSDRDRTLKLLQEMADVPKDKRKAEYISAMALVSPAGKLLKLTVGRWTGEIADAERGENGFGYDPIFLIPELGKTAAEISPAEKNARSHRAQAWRSMMMFLNV